MSSHLSQTLLSLAEYPQFNRWVTETWRRTFVSAMCSGRVVVGIFCFLDPALGLWRIAYNMCRRRRRRSDAAARALLSDCLLLIVRRLRKCDWGTDARDFEEDKIIIQEISRQIAEALSRVLSVK